MARPVRRSVGSVQSSPTPSKVPNSNNETLRTNDLNTTINTASTTVHTIPKHYNNSTTARSTSISTKSINSQFTDNASSSVGSGTDILSNELNKTAMAIIAREKMRFDFYATYDVMTGVRIAATLAGFFGLMVFLIVYKSRSHSSHPLKAMKKNPNLAAQAAIVMQVEEQREFEEAWHATSKFFGIEDGSLPNLGYKRERINSLGNISAPPALHRGFRFSSFAGYSSLLEPHHRRFSYSDHRRKSTSESSRIFSAYQMGESFGEDDYIGESDDEEDNDEFDQGTTTADIGYHHYLNVPGMGHDSRRSSDITCCSTESSYLERRCSAITLGLAPLPSISSRNPSRRPSHVQDICEQRPNIQVIQPTPKCSPFPSEGNLYDKLKVGLTNRKMYEQTDSFDDYISEYTDDLCCHNSNILKNSKSKRNSYNNSSYSNYNNNKIDDLSSVTIDSCTTSNMPQRRAPLASLSSFKISSADIQDSDLKSLGSDSVFAESYADTDEDMEQFSTDSDEISEHNSQKTSHTADQVCINIEDATDNNINNDSNNKVIGNLTSNNNSSCDLSVVNESKNNNSTINLNKILKSNSMNLLNQFETKAIIERHNINDTVVQQRPSSYAGCSSTANDFTTVPSTSVDKLSQNITNIEPDDDDEGDDDYDDNTKSSECFDVDCKNIDNNHAVILELPVIKTNQINLQKPSIKSNSDDVIELDPSIPGPARKWSKETLF